MQFITKFSIILAILLIKNLNTHVHYIFLSLSYIISNIVESKNVENDIADLNIQKIKENLSQKAPIHTEKGVPDSTNKLASNYKEYIEPKKLKFLDDNLCMADNSELGEPLQLVYPNDDHTELILDKEVLNHIKKIPKPVYPVAVIGSVNSGKSFLLNLVNDNFLCNSGIIEELSVRKRYKKDLEYLSPKRDDDENLDSKRFKVSNSPDPETFGIWVYSKPLKISRLKMVEKLQGYTFSDQLNKNLFINVSSDKMSNKYSKLLRNKPGPGIDAKFAQDDSYDYVNVILFDVEGFNSYKSIFRYDEAIFSIISSMCSEVIYLSNKTLNSSDLLLMEELIKSSTQSNISNLYKLYTEIEGVKGDKEETFQYFFKIFENKNLTFLINEFSFSSEQAFDYLANLLKSPRRDLPLHEFFYYHNINKVPVKHFDYQNDLLRRVPFRKHEERSRTGTFVKYKPKKDRSSKKKKKTTKPVKKKYPSLSYEVTDVKFNSFGYIFHMLFKSVNISTLPKTSSNVFLPFFVDKSEEEDKKDPSKPGDEYLQQLGHFKLELFLRSIKSPAVKYCSDRETTSMCYMSGGDIAEMINFTMNTLSFNKFYKLISDSTSSSYSPLTKKQEFDHLFKVFRLARLLMIQNDLIDSYKNILLDYIDMSNDTETPLEGTELKGRKPVKSMVMFEKYSFSLRNQFLGLLLKHFENEGLSSEFNEAWSTLVRELDNYTETAADQLGVKIKNHCKAAAETVFSILDDRVNKIRLPTLPSKLKFLHFFKDEFKSRFVRLVDMEDEDFDFDTHSYANLAESIKDESLFYDNICESVFNDYLTQLDDKIMNVFERNKTLIGEHFEKVFNKAIHHFRANFSELDENYENELQESLSNSKRVIKEAQNIMATEIGEFYALEYLVSEFKSSLRLRLDQELEFFRTSYVEKCNMKLDNMHSHYLNNYTLFLNKFCPLPTDPVLIFKYHEYLRHVAMGEFFRVPCAPYNEIDTRYDLLDNKLKEKYKEVTEKNVNLVSKRLEPEFLKCDKYLMAQVKSCKFYNYFRFNAARYAKFKITGKLIFSKLNYVDPDIEHPIEVLPISQIIYKTSHYLIPLRVSPNSYQEGFLHFLSGEESFYLDEVRKAYIRMNPGEIQYNFINAVVLKYLQGHMPAFKKMFIKKHSKTVVLICSLILLGLSALSFTLAKGGFDKLAFACLGLASYALLVGVETVIKDWNTIRDFSKNVCKKILLFFLNCLKKVLNKVFVLLALVLTKIFKKLGLMYTFIIGFASAASLFLYTKYAMHKRRKALRDEEYCNIKVPVGLLKKLKWNR